MQQNSNPRIILASQNQKKLVELRSILTAEFENRGIKIDPESIVSAADLQLPDVVEDGATFEENALLKARAVAKATNCAAISDDSGLICEVLGNAPGILSARWSGKHGDDLANNELLLSQLESLPRKLRRAKFVTACAFVKPLQNGEFDEKVAFGEMTGEIAFTPRGENGFGYDSIFIPDAYLNDPELSGKHSAELTPEQKTAISHRAAALRSLAKQISA